MPHGRRWRAGFGAVIVAVGLGAAGCGGEDTDSRNGALFPGGNFEVSVDNPYQLQSGPDMRDTDVSVETVGQRFTTNENPTTISRLTVSVARTSAGASGPRDIEFALWSSVNGVPGKRVAGLGSITVEEGFEGFRTLTVTSSPVLGASREYFVVATGGGGDGPVAVQTAVNAPLSNVAPGPEFVSYLASADATDSWLPNETGRNVIMTVSVEPAGSLVVDTTTTTLAGTGNPAVGPATTTPTRAPASTTTVTDEPVGPSGEPTATSVEDTATTDAPTSTAPGGVTVAPASTDSTSTGTDAPTGTDVSSTTTSAVTPVPGGDTSASGTTDTPDAGAPAQKGAAYSPADDPDTTRKVSVTLAAFAALSAAGAAVALGGSPGSGSGSQGGRLATLATKRLKVATTSRGGAGDAGRLWRRRGTERVDALFAGLPARVGPYSSVAPRVLVDGSWMRAMVGSASMVSWPVAAVAGVLWGIDSGDTIGLPPVWLLVLVVALACFDSLLGGLVALSFTVVLAVAGALGGWADVRTMLGLWVLLLSPPLIANVIRPLRRVVHDTETGLRERAFDYVMSPVGVVLAVGALAQTLNGISGTVLVDDGALRTVRWTLWGAMIVRLALEDVVVHSYPERLKSVQPAVLPAQTRLWGVLGAATRFGLYLFVSEPYFGLGTATVVSALLLTVPFAIKPWEKSLPDSSVISRWLPRGFLRFALLVLVGGWLASVLLGDSPTADTVRSMTPWLFVPSALFGIVEYFGRSGVPWPDSHFKRWGGAALWIVVVLVLAGVIDPF